MNKHIQLLDNLVFIISYLYCYLAPKVGPSSLIGLSDLWWIFLVEHKLGCGIKCGCYQSLTILQQFFYQFEPIKSKQFKKLQEK